MYNMVCLGLGIDGEESTEEEVVINESNDVNKIHLQPRRVDFLFLETVTDANTGQQ